MVFKPRVYDGEPKSPASITRELIRESPTLLDNLWSYCCEVAIQLGEQEIWKLPVGLQRLWRIISLDTRMNNGGPTGYFGNITDEADMLIGNEETMSALRAFGGEDIARVMEEASGVWRDFLSAARPFRAKDPHTRQQYLDLYDEVTANLEPYYGRYSALRMDLFKQSESYARAHEDEFVHTFD